MSNCEDVVISGVAGWFPGCTRSLPELGRRLLDNEYLVQRDAARWTNAELGEEPLFGSMGDYGDFDHSFFGMHQKLAYWTDPAARLCIERSFEAIIDAGLSPRELRGSKTNVYVSSTFNDFEALMLDHFEAPSGYAIAGMSRTMIPNRISYFYDLKGQSCGFDGNWPWGELGLQMALDAIRNGYCDAALVLASSVVHRPERTAQSRPLGLVSDDGLCRSFDAQASGGQRADAVVCFVVQRADRAKRCYARVVASRCALAGPLSGDPATHSAAGVERVLRDLYEDCGEDPNQVAYLEADGSGCKAWEEAELGAADAVLGRAWRHGSRRAPLLVGSVKSNLGHTDGCAGMLAVAKLIVTMETGVIPASINHAVANPAIVGLREGRLQVVTTNTPMEVGADTLLAATTLGLGGAVGHVLLRANAKRKRQSQDAVPRIVTISGRSEEGVLAALQHVQAQPFDPEYLRLVQDAFTDIKGHTVRGFTIAPPLRGQPPQYRVEACERRPLVLVFSGMGSQWPGMGRGLMGLEAFAASIERLHRVLEDRGTGLDLKHIISDESPSAFDDIINSFVGITAVQVALTNVLWAAGLRPDMLLGHSLGELACGYADGCLTEEQTILASYVRGRAATQAHLVKGMMAAVGLGWREVAHRLPASLDVACHNSAQSCTLAGPAADVEEFVAVLQAEGVFARAVNASDVAFHSRYVRPAAPLVLDALKTLIPAPRARSARWLSTSVPEARWAEAEARTCSPEYQTNNLLSPVLFEEVLAHVPDDAVLLEVAPHGLLQAILKRALPDHHHLSLTQRGAPSGVHTALEAIGGLYSLGLNPVVSALCPEVSLPVSRGTPSLVPLVSWNHAERNTFLDRPPQEGRAACTTTINADSAFMDVAGKSFRPVSEMILDVLAGFRRAVGEGAVPGAATALRDVHVYGLAESPASGERTLTTTFLAVSGRFETTDWTGKLLLSGKIHLMDDNDSVFPGEEGDSGPAEELAEELGADAVYAALGSRGLVFGQRLRALRWLHKRPQVWEAEAAPELRAQLASSLQVLQLAALEDGAVPAAIQRLDVLQGGGDGRLRFHRCTGYVESSWLRLEGVQVRPLEKRSSATVAPKPDYGRATQTNWKSPDSLGMSIRSTDVAAFEEKKRQLSGLVCCTATGERVMAVGAIGAEEAAVQVEPSLVWPVPEPWSDAQAAAAPVAYCRAAYALHTLARASTGESVLVHDGMSPLGQACVSLALGLGCNPIFVTVRTEAERQQLARILPELPQQNALLLSSFEWALRLRLGTRGVDVAVGAVVGEQLKASLRCMALWGRYVHCAPGKDGREATVGMGQFLQSVSLFGVPEDGMLLTAPDKIRGVAEVVRAGLAGATLRPLQPTADPEQRQPASPQRPAAAAAAPPQSDSHAQGAARSLDDRLAAALPAVRLRRSASLCGRPVRVRPLSSLAGRPGRRSNSVTPRPRTVEAVPASASGRSTPASAAASPAASAAAQPADGREVFPLFALAPLGLPLDPQAAAGLRELASRLMMPVAAVELPWPADAAGGLAGQARAVVDLLRGRGPGPVNLLGWGPGTPLALEVARQLDDLRPTCTFLLDGDVRAVQSWAARQARLVDSGGPASDNGLGVLSSALRDLASHDPSPNSTPSAMLPKRGRVIVLRGSNKDASCLEGLPNVEVRTVRPAQLDSLDVASAINAESTWSRMAYKTRSRPDSSSPA